MRGDSIRDFYAKTLALLGLGVLAGTGALVDYWPVSSVSLPVADSALTLPELARSKPVPATGMEPVLRVAAASARSTAGRSVVVPALSVQPSSELLVGEPIALNDPPPAALALAPLSASRGHDVPLEFSPFEPATPVATMAMLNEPVPAASASNDDRDGFLTGAVKRTGSSIARTGAKTGASIWDALRTVSGAVRRALPD